MTVEIIELRPCHGNKPLRAFVDIKINGWIIYDWRIVQQQGQRAWVTVPQTSWKDADGKVKYRALLSIPGELKQRIEVAILSAWEKELGNDRSTP